MSMTREHRSEVPARVDEHPTGAPIPRTVRLGQLGRAALALLLLVGLIGIAPLLLVRLGAVLPVPGLRELIALSPLRADDGSMLLAVLLAIAWLAWGALAISVAVEVVSVARKAPSPRLPGLVVPQRLAGWLVASLLLAAVPTGSPTPAAAIVGDNGLSRILVDVEQALPAQPDRPAQPDPVPTVHGDSDRALPTVRSQRHDTLWLLAEQHLGAGGRFTEIVELNLGTDQPDGRSLGRDGRIYPGWELRLPRDAVLDTPRPDRVVVAAGDTLWDLAAEELGDPHRYQDLFEANRGDLQPDGRRLLRADIIQPGWVLTLPGSKGNGQPDRHSEDARAGDRDEAPGESSPAVPHPSPALDPPHPDAPDLDRAPDPPAAAASANPEAAEPAAATSDPDPADRDLPDLDRAGEAPAATASDDPDAVATPLPRTPLPRTPDPRVSDLGAPDPAAAVRSLLGVGQPLPPLDRAVATLAESSVVPASSTVTGVLLAAIAAELVRRRRQFQRHRRPGERIRELTRPERDLEGTLRAAQGSGGDLLDPALRALAAQARAAGRDLPRIRVVRVDAQGVDLHLAEDEEPLVPFVAAGERRWSLDPEQLGETPESPDEGGHDAEQIVLPGLVTLGTDGGARVLVDLAELGTLRVAGPPIALANALRALTTELAFGRPREGTEPILGMAAIGVAEAAQVGEVGLEPNPMRLAAAIRSAVARFSGEPGPSSDPLQVVLTDQPLPMTVGSRCGVGLVTTQPGAWAGGALVLDAQGGAILLPELIRLDPQSMGESDERALVGLFASTEVPDDPEPADPDPSSGPDLDASPDFGLDPDLDPDLGSEPDGIRPSPDAPGVPAAPPAPPAPPGSRGALGGRSDVSTSITRAAPTVLVLGDVRVLDPGGPAESTRIGRLAETTAFVLLNPLSRPSELQAALWPQRRSNPQTCRQMISRTRTWLGRSVDGDSYLEPFSATQGRLRLRADVGSDWAQFQALAQAGFADPDDTASLSAALRLVRGRPFGSLAGRELAWADLHVNEMLCLITDVAHELAVRHESAGSWSAARDAVLRGLRTQTESELLTADLARLQRMG